MFSTPSLATSGYIFYIILRRYNWRLPNATGGIGTRDNLGYVVFIKRWRRVRVRVMRKWLFYNLYAQSHLAPEPAPDPAAKPRKNAKGAKNRHIQETGLSGTKWITGTYSHLYRTKIEPSINNSIYHAAYQD